jgi:hypothetical protein
VIEETPPYMLYPLPPGYVLLDARRGRPLRAWAAHLEFRDLPDEQRRLWSCAPLHEFSRLTVRVPVGSSA